MDTRLRLSPKNQKRVIARKEKQAEEKARLPLPQPGKQEQFYSSQADITVYGGSAGSGKLQCAGIYRYRIEYFDKYKKYCSIGDVPQYIIDMETKVLTQKSWKYLSDIEPGDMIMNPDGSPQRVIRVFENGIQPLYRVTFEDRTSTLAGGDHLWGYWIPRENSRSKVASVTYQGNHRPIYPEWNCNYVIRARVGTTLELQEKLDKGKKILIPICSKMRFARASGKLKKMNPYLLGVLLGDGMLVNPKKGYLTFCKSLEDEAIANRLREEGLTVALDKVDYPSSKNARTKPFAYWSVESDEQFEALGSYGLLYKSAWEKFIPPWYLWSPLETRLALAQGLMDTDGYAAKDRNEAEYSTTSERLADDVTQLFRSLGYIVKPRLVESPMYKTKDGESKTGRPAWRITIQGNDLKDLFSLARKKDRCKPFNGGVSWAGKNIISIEYERDEYSRCLQVSHPNRLYVTDDFNVTHNSFGLLLSLAKPEYLENSQYNAAIFRRTYPEIKNPGGILDDSQKLYYQVKGNLTHNPLDWRFPSGAKIVFRHLQHEKTKHEYQGSQMAIIAFDELTHFSSSQFFYMLSRNRSTCGIKPKIYGTCNPDADSWVADLISWYLNDEGFPDPEKSGIIRYFIRLNDEIIWRDRVSELINDYPDINPDTDIKSFTFIPALIDDNQILLDKDPGYLGNLKAQHPVEKARLLYGNWKIKYEAGTIFNRTWFRVVDELPNGDIGTTVRFWDFAATAKEVAKETHYYSAGCKACKIGKYIVILDLITEQRSPGELDELVSSVSQSDGVATKVRWELEGGSAGRLYEKQLKDKLQKENPGVDAIAVKPLGDKVTRAIPAANAASGGRILLLRGAWIDQFLGAVSSFDGSPKPLTNDIVDSFDGAFALLDSIPEYDWEDFAETLGTRL